jgi:2-succinyl-5-enolpyruvyl-6-hydroxy-3-cyclohexene-1-carboxylate synthase
VVAGPGADAEGAAIARLAEHLGWPSLADPLSGARMGAAAIAHYDALLRDDRFVQRQRPEVVLRFGDVPTSKPLRQWLASLDVPQIAGPAAGAWPDPDGRLSQVVGPGAVRALLALFADPANAPAPAPDAWLTGWRAADAAAATAIDAALGDALSEPRVAAELARSTPESGVLVVASSMPIRDVETFAAVREPAPRVLANRGANGIDGTLATAFGVAAAHDGPVAALLGDVAFAYDVSALLCAKRHGHAITVVVINNGGGGIFEFLPLAGIDRATFEEHVATDPGLDIARAAALYECDHVAPDTPDGFAAAVGAARASERTTIIEIRTDRGANVTAHREVWAAVAAAL